MEGNKFNSKEVWMHFFIWVSIYAFILYQFANEFNQIPFKLLVKLGIGLVLFYCNYFLLVPFLLLKRKLLVYFIVSMVALVVLGFISHEFLMHDRVPPINGPLRPRPLEPAVGLRRFPLLMPDTAIFALHFVAGALTRIYKEWNRSEVLKKEIENQRVNSQLQFLKTQLNPHFLFNSLNAIYSLSEKKSNDTGEAILNLSELMRYMLYEANGDKVSLASEINYIENYVQLQKLRLPHTATVQFKVTGDERNKEITPLIFISFIENAFKYGTDYKGNTHVVINLLIKERSIEFKVENTIGRKKRVLQSSGIGLTNIKDRLLLLYPDNHELLVNKGETLFTVLLKLNLV